MEKGAQGAAAPIPCASSVLGDTSAKECSFVCSEALASLREYVHRALVKVPNK